MSRFSEIHKLILSYNKIHESYNRKKQDSWTELIDSVEELSHSKPGILLDVGSGNGRNLKKLNRTLVIAVDSSESLLRGFVGNLDISNRVVGVLPLLPFRKNALDEVFTIAVIHHLPTQEARKNSFKNIDAVMLPRGRLTVTLWRKWRPGLKKKLLKRIREHKPIDDLVNHSRPWKDSKGNILANRFYHYYTFREVLEEVKESNFKIEKRVLMGGKFNNDNFLIVFKKE